MSDTLARILAYKRAEVDARRAAQPLAVVRAAAEAADPPRGFRRALAAKATGPRPALIAEVKKASPSKGLIRDDFRPADIARAYEGGGASCLSVLTDAPSFQGADAHLLEARAACALPVLRKDFLIDPYQVAEARALGADAVLIIMAALDDIGARALLDAANAFGMDALVEVHDAPEMARARSLGATLVGVNNRDLRTFETRLDTFDALAPKAPDGALVVAESGIASPADVARVRAAGAHAILVGESLMRASDVRVATERLLA